MTERAPAELRFPELGSVAYGYIAYANGPTVTVRFVEGLRQDVFVYGRSAVLIYPHPSGLAEVPCRMVAEYAAGTIWDIIVVMTGEPEVTERRVEPRIRCHLDGRYRAVHGGRACGAWMQTTIIDLSRSGMGVLVPERPDFPATVEVQIALPETLVRNKTSDSRGVTLVRRGAPMPPEVARPIRLRADLRYRRHEGPDTVVGLEFQTLPASVQGRLAELLLHLADRGERLSFVRKPDSFDFAKAHSPEENDRRTECPGAVVRMSYGGGPHDEAIPPKAKSRELRETTASASAASSPASWWLVGARNR